MRRAALAAALVACAGCFSAGGAPAGHWNGKLRRLCDDDVCYRVGPLGGGWRMVHRQGGAIGFYSASMGGVIEGNANCRDDAEAASLNVLLGHLLLGYTERRERSRELVYLDWREALHTVVDARLDGVPVVLDLYVLKRDGCVYDLSYAAPAGSYPLGRADFSRFVAGFAAWPRRS